jgi:molybdenum-dependent DNA-binding transcriptional regulator ModE
MRKKHPSPSLDRFAESLAQTGHVETSASQLGMSKTRAWAAFKEIKNRLGWQAQ